MTLICGHVAIYVHDLRAAEEFYRRAFGIGLLFRETRREGDDWYALRPHVDWDGAEGGAGHPDRDGRATQRRLRVGAVPRGTTGGNGRRARLGHVVFRARRAAGPAARQRRGKLDRPPVHGPVRFPLERPRERGALPKQRRHRRALARLTQPRGPRSRRETHAPSHVSPATKSATIARNTRSPPATRDSPSSGSGTMAAAKASAIATIAPHHHGQDRYVVAAPIASGSKRTARKRIASATDGAACYTSTYSSATASASSRIATPSSTSSRVIVSGGTTMITFQCVMR